MAVLLLTLNPAGSPTRQPFHAAPFARYCLKGETRVTNFLLERSFQNFVPLHWLDFGKDRKITKAVEVFVAHGFTRPQAAGMVGNLMHESDLKPTARGDSGGSYGIAQWRGYRFRNLQQFARQRGTDWQDYETQLLFLIHELERDETKACMRLKRAGSVAEATQVFGRLYLRPRRMEGSRYKHAHKVYARLAASQDNLHQLWP